MVESEVADTSKIKWNSSTIIPIWIFIPSVAINTRKKLVQSEIHSVVTCPGWKKVTVAKRRKVGAWLARDIVITLAHLQCEKLASNPAEPWPLTYLLTYLLYTGSRFTLYYRHVLVLLVVLRAGVHCASHAHATSYWGIWFHSVPTVKFDTYVLEITWITKVCNILLRACRSAGNFIKSSTLPLHGSSKTKYEILDCKYQILNFGFLSSNSNSEELLTFTKNPQTLQIIPKNSHSISTVTLINVVNS